MLGRSILLAAALFVLPGEHKAAPTGAGIQQFTLGTFGFGNTILWMMALTAGFPCHCWPPTVPEKAEKNFNGLCNKQGTASSMRYPSLSQAVWASMMVAKHADLWLNALEGKAKGH
ncbi:hypothetical protein C8F01DRAFT_1078487 [Mycena amicta]|nr:hypothetical protein C8F01DRAFT_1078487 [Mycena amicta]